MTEHTGSHLHCVNLPNLVVKIHESMKMTKGDITDSRTINGRIKKAMNPLLPHYEKAAFLESISQSFRY